MTLKEIENKYKENIFADEFSIYKKTEAECSKCGSPLYQNVYIVLTSYPPQYQYICKACGNVETSTISLI